MGSLALSICLDYDHNHMKKHTYRCKTVTHERIVDAAARAIRRGGYAGLGIAEIMKSVGLTHGGFYAHFASRDAMLAEAADRAGAEMVALITQVTTAALPEEALGRLVQTYLSVQHLEGVENGCPIAALGSEMPRQAPEVRHVATCRIKEMIDTVARQLPSSGETDVNKEALVTLSTMVGALILARAVDDPQLSDALREAAVEKLGTTSH